MSRFVMEISGQFIEEIDSIDVCKKCINGVCCNEKGEWLGASAFACIDKEHCEYFEEEDGIVRR